MIRGQYVTAPGGRVLQYLEAWSPDGTAGPTRLKPRRVRYTFRDVATGEYVDLWDVDSATVRLTPACEVCGAPAGYRKPGHHDPVAV